MCKAWTSHILNKHSNGQRFLKMTQILIFTQSAASVFMMAICMYSRMLWRVIRWLSTNCKKSLFAMKINLILKKQRLLEDGVVSGRAAKKPAGWTNKTPQILTNSKHWLCKNWLPSVRMWPRSWLTACQGELQSCWKRRANAANIDSFHQLDVIVNKSLWYLWNLCNYTSVCHSNIWQGSKTL